jgi:hypothetical protein
MSVALDPVAGTAQRIEIGGDARVRVHQARDRFSQHNLTGTMAAALAATSTVFAMRVNPGSTKKIRVQRINLEFTTVAAFTVPQTIGRRLAIFRGAGAATSAGTLIGVSSAMENGGAVSQCDSAQGGRSEISATVGLTTTGITFEASPIWGVSLAHLGAAGAYGSFLKEFYDTLLGPLILAPGELLAIRNPQAFDAGGTWNLGVHVEWAEVADLP